MYFVCVRGEDDWMDEVDLSVVGPRRRRSAAERRGVVEETLEPGASVARVARVARKYGINANQVFMWRRLYRDGKLGGAPADRMKLLPVSVIEDDVPAIVGLVGPTASSSGAIHIELPGDIRISLEGSVDRDLVSIVLKSLRT